MRRFFHYLLSRQMVEHMDSKEQSLFLRRIWADHLARYEFAKQYTQSKIVLDIACGDGYGSSLLAETATKVTGVDISEETINQARKKYTNVNLNFAASDALRFFENSSELFDVIVSFETIEHIAEYKILVRQMRAHLTPGGYLILSTPNKQFSDWIAGDTFNPYHVKEFYPKELVQLVSGEFNSDAKLFWQRPINKSNYLMGVVTNFLLKQKSEIIPEDSKHDGLDILLVVQK